MTLITRPFLSDEFVKQVSTDILTMSGVTNFVGTLKSKGVIINASTGGTAVGHVLTYNGSQILLLPQSGGTARGNALVDNIDQTAHGFGLMDVLGHTSSGYVKVSALVGQPEAIGVVSKIYNPNRFEITYQGFVTGLTGATATGTQSTFTGNTTYFLSSTVPGALTNISPTTIGHISKPMLVTLTNNTGLIFNWRGSIIASGNTTATSGLTQSSGVLGVPTDGTFADGLLVFTASTKTVDAVDEINEVLKLLSPSAAPDLTNISKTSSGTYQTGKLSFGVSRNDISYANVTSSGGNAALDINGTYAPAGTRLGITNASTISGVLNDSVTVGSSYPADAFGEADKGTLTLSLNGVVIDTLNLTSTGATVSTNGRMSVTSVSAVTTSAGQPFNFKKYRKGTYNIPNTLFVNGFNYLRITHNRGSTTVNTNFLEFVYDPETSVLSFNGTPTFRPPVLTGSKYISGVRYHTGGTIQYSAVTSNVYKNVYSASASAFSYSVVNISDAVSIVKSGAGLVTETNSGKNLPALNAAVSNPQATTLTLLSTHTITAQRVLGQLTTTANSLRCSITITHPLKTTLVSSQTILTGLLMDSLTQGSITNNQTFDGETDRLQNRDYSSLTYTNINNGVYGWDSTQNLVTGDANHNTGLLVFGGELMYPNSSYLNTTYSISSGNFSTLTYGYAFNPNYSTASGIRVHNTKFKSTNTTTQSTLTIDILHSAGNTSFLTNGGTGGTISGNNIKVECIIKRSGGSTHGYFNPFASSGNPEGIANTAITSIAGGTRVSCTLSTIPRVGNGDIVIVRIRANGWAGVISNIQITNI